MKLFLSLELKFSVKPTTKYVNIPRLLAEIDPVTKKVHGLEKEARVTNVVTNFSCRLFFVFIYMHSKECVLSYDHPG